MQAIAKAKMTRTSPRKISLVAALIRKQPAEQAQVILANTNKGAAATVATVLDAAIANAENNMGLKKANLTVQSVLVGAGPTLKRMRPRSRGQGSAIMKRTSHITIILSDQIDRAIAEKPVDKKLVEAVSAPTETKTAPEVTKSSPKEKK